MFVDSSSNYLLHFSLTSSRVLNGLFCHHFHKIGHSHSRQRSRLKPKLYLLLLIFLFLKALLTSELLLFLLCQHERDSHLFISFNQLVLVGHWMLNEVSYPIHVEVLLFNLTGLKLLLSLRQKEGVPPVELGQFCGSSKSSVYSNTRLSKHIFSGCVRQSNDIFRSE